MTLYRYEAAAASGDLIVGEMEASDRNAVIAHLQEIGYVPIRADTARTGLAARLFTSSLTLRRKAKAVDLTFLTQQLATMVQAGLALDRALEVALRVIETTAERDCVRSIFDLVRGGRSLADAMAAQGGLFPPYYIGMVRAGEAGGSLDVTLRYLAELLDRSKAAREQVKSALVYPLIVLATGGASIAILFGFVIPRFRPLFEQAGGELPLPTQIVLALSDGVRDDWWMALVAVVIAVLLWRRYVRTPDGRRWRDAHLLRLPLVGDLVTKLEISRFSRTLGTLLLNGVSPLTALTITHETITNVALRDGLATVLDSVKEGKGLSEPLAQTGLVPTLAVQLTHVGEETARLDSMLLKIGEIYEEETKRSIERLLAFLVPAVTIGLGIIVALVIGTIMTAVLSVYDLAL
jgi:general secretion pathway protein F